MQRIIHRDSRSLPLAEGPDVIAGLQVRDWYPLAPMHLAREPRHDYPRMGIRIQAAHPMSRPDLAKRLDNGNAEETPGTEAPRPCGAVHEHLGSTRRNIHQGATVGADVISDGGTEDPKPFLADEVIGGEHHEPLSAHRDGKVKGRPVLRSKGLVRHLNEPDAELIKQSDVRLVPDGHGSGNL